MELLAQPEELSRPVHDYSLQLGTCGATDPLRSRGVSLWRYRFEGTYTLKPGFVAMVAYRSPMIPSNVEATG